MMHSEAARDAEPMQVRSKIWIERDGDVILSDWRVALLEAIDANGSLSRAAEAMQVPYRTAWERVKSTETRLGVRLMESESGGANGGGSRLTPEAREICQRFRRVSGGIHDVITQRFRDEFGENRQ